MLSNYSSFLEISAGIYASICFDDVLNNIWSSQYYKRLKPIFKSISINSYTNLSESLIEENQEWVLTLKKPMVKRATLMFVIVFLSSVYIGFEDEIQKNHELISQLRTSLVTMVFIILFLVYGLCHRIVFSKWKNLLLSIIILFFLSIITFCLVSRYSLQCNVCNKYFSPIFILFILIPLIAQLISSWVYSSLYIGYVRGEIYTLLDEYNNAVKMLEQKNKELMPKEYAEIFVAEILKDSGNVTDTCVELFNNHLFEKITAITKPKGVWEILISWVKYQYNNIFGESQRRTPVYEQQHNNLKSSSQYPIPEQVLLESKVRLELDYSKEHQEYRKCKKVNPKLGLKDFCKQRNIKYEEMKLWLDNRGNNGAFKQ